jgi:pimeloyl-ACP methyl ester carboxylesterase
VLQFNLPLAFHPSRAQDSVLQQTYLDMVLAAGAQQLIAQNRAVIARPDARLHLPQLRCPVLVMCGDADALTPPERSREIAALAQQASLLMVAQCGHMLTLERPQEVSHAVLHWLNGHIYI